MVEISVCVCVCVWGGGGGGRDILYSFIFVSNSSH